MQGNWGHAKDYVRAMWLMPEKKPDDYGFQLENNIQ